ncbi:hypothetical protein K9M47_02370 [Candidatus Gracilibacteria bacterium]|nr:hypothetical protein [Candidatus Gracilibacteria bacterium]MCF7898869.1 hypothetical protein [Candidatus Paceibacterota bacterium]
MLSQENGSVAKVIRVKSGEGFNKDLLNDESSQPTWRGFGSIRGETIDEFHDRMFEIPPLEAVLYEMEVALGS